MAIFALACGEMSEEEKYERIYGRPDDRCPAIDEPTRPIHLEHNTDCDKFYKCYMQRAYLMDCPAGLWWKQEKGYCDNKEGVCQKSPAVLDRNPRFKIDCPETDDPWKPVHIAHPFECDKFFKCARGVGVLMDCPANLHWSTEFDRCEFPERANCKA